MKISIELFKLFAVWLVFGFLISFPIELSGTLTFLFVLALTSWLSYQYIYPIRYLRRAAYLEKTLNTDSHWQGLANSSWVKIRSAITAVAVAFSAVYVVASFGHIANLPYLEWTLLFLSAPAFLLIYQLLKNKAGQHFKKGNESLILWPLARISIIIITIAYTLIYVFFADLPDVKTLEWGTVLAEQKSLIDTPMPWLGWLLAYDNTAQLILMNCMQLGSQLEISLWLKLFSWVAFIIIIGLKIGLVWWVALGAISYIIVQSEEGTSPINHSSKFFSITLTVLFGLYLLVSNINFGSLIDTVEATRKHSESYQEKPIIDVCNPEKVDKERQQLETQITEALDSKQRILKTQLDRRIDQALDNALSSPEFISAIEDFLDWNFSIKGSYLQTFYKGKDLFDEDGLNKFILSKFNEKVGKVLEQNFNNELSGLKLFVEKSLGQAATQVVGSIKQPDYSCLSFNSEDINVDEFITVYGGGGGVVGVMSARISAKIGAKISARLATKLATRILAKASAKLATRFAAVTVGAGTGALACAATGPIAVLCAVGAGIVTWISADYVIVSVDEYLNRDDLRAMVFESIDNQKIEIKDNLKNTFNNYIDKSFTQMSKQYRKRVRVIDILRNKN